LVAARIFANPVSNVFQKQLAERGASPLFIIAATHALLTLVCLPFASLDPGREFWMYIGICAVLAVASNVLLVYALQAADLSVLGPINAYKSVISLVLGAFLLREVPSPMGVAGVLLIIAGSYAVVGRTQFMGGRGVQLRIAALVLSATEAVFDKKALLAASPATAFVWWSILGLPVAAAVAAVVHRARLRNEVVLLRRNWSTYVWLALATGTMQIMTFLAFGRLQVGYTLAFFQLSALVSVFLGHHVFRESHIRRRLIGSAIMVAGAGLIVALGR